MKQNIFCIILILGSIYAQAQNNYTQLPRINKVVLNDNSNVTIIEENADQSGISVTSNKKPGYRVKEGVLYIDDQSIAKIAINNLNQIEANDVSVVTLNGGFSKGLEVIANDATRVKINGNLDVVVIEANDASYITLDGKANSLNVKTNDASKVDGSIIAKHLFAKSFDVSRIVVYGDKYVDTQVNDHSNIEILKNPSTKSTVSDSVIVEEETIRHEMDDQFDGVGKDIEKWNKKKIKWRPNQRVWSGFEMSVTGLSNDLFDFQPNELHEQWAIEQPSVSFHINILEHKFRLGTDYVKFLSGLGMQWDVLRLKKDVTLQNSRDKIQLVDSQYGTDLKKNNLILGQIQIPLLLNFNTKPGSKYNFHIDGGVVVGYRFKQVQKQEIVVDYKTSIDQNIKSQFHQNPFDFSATLRLGVGEWSVFGMYDLTSLYKKNEGPQLKVWNIGVTIIPF